MRKFGHSWAVGLTLSQPFNNVKNSTFQDAGSRWLEIIDGGSNLENVPMGAMLVKARAVDVLIAVDGSADDTNSWPKCVLVSSRIQIVDANFYAAALLPSGQI